MPDLIRDPDLDRLVRDLNAGRMALVPSDDSPTSAGDAEFGDDAVASADAAIAGVRDDGDIDADVDAEVDERLARRLAPSVASGDAGVVAEKLLAPASATTAPKAPEPQLRARGPADIPERSAEIPERSAGIPERSAEIPERGADIADGEPLEKILRRAILRQATDVLLLAGVPPILRVHGQLVALSSPPLTGADVGALMLPHASSAARRAALEQGSADLSLRLAGSGSADAWRFRVNLHRQKGALAAAIRVLPRGVPTLESLSLPSSLADLVNTAHGLVLACGPTGSGKTSTLAALVGEINRRRTCHVITIEDPIEYEHVPDRSIIEQVEIGRDTPSFAAALRAALRQDPDVILVGEMRDLDTIATALTAAETGHLVLSTLHARDVAQAIHRIVDVFPAAQQGQVRQQLALSLHAITSQHLVPRADGSGRVPAVEVLVANYAVRQHVRKDRVQVLHSELTIGRPQGMLSLEESLARLVRSRTITLEEARLRATHPGELLALLGLPADGDA